jgi:hypothetical protein
LIKEVKNILYSYIIDWFPGGSILLILSLYGKTVPSWENKVKPKLKLIGRKN